MIKNIIFDMGNVLLKFDRNYFLDAVGVKPADRRTLMNNVYLSLEWAKMDRGSMTEEEAADYVKQSDAYARKIAMGTALCSACVAPMMLLVALMSAFDRPDVGGMLGCVNMFVMIGMGVYCLVTAKKPENRSRIRSGKFSLSASLRKKLMARKARADEKARHKKGLGSALLATCVLPIFAGAALDSLWGLYSNPFAILGVGAMFLMIGAGVYELTAANGEKKPIKDLLKE